MFRVSWLSACGSFPCSGSLFPPFPCDLSLSDLDRDADDILLMEDGEEDEDEDEEDEDAAASEPPFRASLLALLGGSGELPGVRGMSSRASFLLMILKISLLSLLGFLVAGDLLDGCFVFSGSTVCLPELLDCVNGLGLVSVVC